MRVSCWSLAISGATVLLERIFCKKCMRAALKCYKTSITQLFYLKAFISTFHSFKFRLIEWKCLPRRRRTLVEKIVHELLDWKWQRPSSMRKYWLRRFPPDQIGQIGDSSESSSALVHETFLLIIRIALTVVCENFAHTFFCRKFVASEWIYHDFCSNAVHRSYFGSPSIPIGQEL